jgi:hypothetical protein
MANIQVSELLPVGYELFNDESSFLNELGNQEIENVLGGGHSHRYNYSRHSHHSHRYQSHSSNSYSRRWDMDWRWGW